MLLRSRDRVRVENAKRSNHGEQSRACFFPTSRLLRTILVRNSLDLASSLPTDLICGEPFFHEALWPGFLRRGPLLFFPCINA